MIDKTLSKLLIEHSIVRLDIMNNRTFKDFSNKLKSKISFLRNKYSPKPYRHQNTDRTKKRSGRYTDEIMNKKNPLPLI